MARSIQARALAPVAEPARLPSELEELCKELERNRAAVSRANQALRATKAKVRLALTYHTMSGCEYPDAHGIRREAVREERLVLRKVKR